MQGRDIILEILQVCAERGGGGGEGKAVVANLAGILGLSRRC